MTRLHTGPRFVTVQRPTLVAGFPSAPSAEATLVNGHSNAGRRFLGETIPWMSCTGRSDSL